MYNRKMRKYFLFLLPLLISCGISSSTRAKTILLQGLNDTSPIVRINAAVGLRSEEASAVLVDMLLNGNDEERAGVLEAISQHDVSLPEPLVTKACSSANPSVREAAYQVVSQSEFVGARVLLLNGLQDELAAVRVLSYSGLIRFNEVERLESGLRDPEVRVRIAAAKALGELGRAGMSEFIKDELKKSTPELVGTGIKAMAELGDTASIPLFKALLNESAGDMRIDAAEALLILGDHTGVVALKKGLQSNDPFVRIHTAKVLTRHKLPETYSDLEAATRDELMNVAVQSVNALSQHEPLGYRELFLELMDAQNPVLRIAAAAAYLRSQDGA